MQSFKERIILDAQKIRPVNSLALVFPRAARSSNFIGVVENNEKILLERLSAQSYFLLHIPPYRQESAQLLSSKSYSVLILPLLIAFN